MSASDNFEGLLSKLRECHLLEVRHLRDEFGDAQHLRDQFCAAQAMSCEAIVPAEFPSPRSPLQEMDIASSPKPRIQTWPAEVIDLPVVPDLDAEEGSKSKMAGLHAEPDPEEFVKQNLQNGEDDATELKATDETAWPSPKPPRLSMFSMSNDTFDSRQKQPLDDSLFGTTRRILTSNPYECLLVALVMINAIIVALEFEYSGYQTGHTLQYTRMMTPPSTAWPNADEMFLAMNVALSILFTVDVVVRIAFLQCEFFKYWSNWLDLVVVISSLVELALGSDLPVSTVFLRLIRLAKLARVTRIVRWTSVFESLHLLMKCLWSSVAALFWSVCMLGMIQCIAGMIISQTLQPYLDDDSVDPEIRKEVFRYYGTFSKTMLSMSEVLFANWVLPCRVLVDHVSDNYICVFIIYRCLVGFAILNVVNAVFVQQTMKVAQADLAFMMACKQTQINQYCAKLKDFFNEVDESGDGVLSWDEFKSIVDSPKLKIWMSTLELEASDLVNLFHLLDDGDGEISVDEFIEGAVRLRGQARSIDMAEVLANSRRTEAKVDTVLTSVAELSGAEAQKLKKSASSARTRKIAKQASRTDLLSPDKK